VPESIVAAVMRPFIGVINCISFEDIYRNCSTKLGTHSIPRVEFHTDPYELQSFDESDIVTPSVLSGYKSVGFQHTLE
jgi:hypothetical protein